jgi:hypothetical protein
MAYKETMRMIINALRLAKLVEPFSASDVNAAIGITYAGTFLPKHRVGNPGRNTALFVQVSSWPSLFKVNPKLRISD